MTDVRQMQPAMTLEFIDAVVEDVKCTVHGSPELMQLVAQRLAERAALAFNQQNIDRADKFLSQILSD